MAKTTGAKQRPALGRGLSALISAPQIKVEPTLEKASSSSAKLQEKAEDKLPQNGDLIFVQTDKLEANPDQPRKVFDSLELEELSNSLKQHGLLQPICVRPVESGNYQIIAGERRWRAAKLAKLTRVPVIVYEKGDLETLELALVENIQRSNLSILELARSYQFLMDEHGISQQQVADKVGKDRSSVSNTVRLLKLPTEVQEMIEAEKLSFGHAKAILTVKEPAAQINLANKCLSENLSVREIEAIVARVVVLPQQNPKSAQKKNRGKNSNEALQTVEDRLRKVLGTKVAIQSKSPEKGAIVIEYFSEPELDRLVELICSEK